MKNLDWNTVEMTIDFKPGFVPVMDAVPVDLGSGTNKYKIVVKQESIIDFIQKPMVDALQAWVKDQAAEALTGDQRRERERALSIIDEIDTGCRCGCGEAIAQIRKAILGGMEPEAGRPLDEMPPNEWSDADGPVPGSGKVDIQVRGGLPLLGVNADSVLWKNVTKWRLHIPGNYSIDSAADREAKIRDKDTGLTRAETDAAGIWTEWHGGCSPVPLDVMVDIVLRDGHISTNMFADDVRWAHIGNDGDVVRWRRHVEKAVDPAPPDADGWHPWTGGVCPITRDTLIEVKLRNGERNSHKAVEYRWDHCGEASDIVAWRFAVTSSELIAGADKIRDGWHDFKDGDKMPVSPETLVDFECKCGQNTSRQMAGAVQWNNPRDPVLRWRLYRAPVAVWQDVPVTAGFLLDMEIENLKRPLTRIECIERVATARMKP